MRSRSAAIAGLAMFSADRMLFFVNHGLRGSWITVIVVLAFLQGVRGTIAYHKLPPKPQGMPSIEDSFRAVAEKARAESVGGK